MCILFFDKEQINFGGIELMLYEEKTMKSDKIYEGKILNLKVDTIEWTILILCMILVLSLEMINSAIEKICDLIQPNQHPQIKIIKDVAAGAVLLASIGAAIIGAIILLPKLHILF